jgi:hypothetical protein
VDTLALSADVLCGSLSLSLIIVVLVHPFIHSSLLRHNKVARGRCVLQVVVQCAILKKLRFKNSTTLACFDSWSWWRLTEGIYL